MNVALTILEVAGLVGGLLFLLKFVLVAYDDIMDAWRRRRARLTCEVKRIR